jgi:hypothetical protein
MTIQIVHLIVLSLHGQAMIEPNSKHTMAHTWRGVTTSSYIILTKSEVCVKVVKCHRRQFQNFKNVIHEHMNVNMSSREYF